MKINDLTGRRFGRLTVVGDSGQRSGHSILYRCRCDCGGEILAIRHQLVSGTITDCGCIQKERPPLVTDLIGQHFGRLTVEKDSGKRKDGCILWHCVCDCGGADDFTRSELVSGRAVSCGCVPGTRASTGCVEDLAGRQFGNLTVLRRAPNDQANRVCWLCRCACGKECTVQALRLKSGHTQSCGCKRADASHNRRDLTGMRFGRLTVLYRADVKTKAQKTLWHCRCDCGNEIDVFSGSLLRGLTKSCGCLNREVSRNMHGHMHYQDGTCLEILERSQKNQAENKAGFRGLFLTKKGRYRASITFRKSHYTLGYFKTFAEAVQARLDAEETLHAGYIRANENYEKRAVNDPAWAEANPFYYHVTRHDGRFTVSTNGTG